MKSLDSGRAPLPDGADDAAVTELLAHWDELPAEGLANLAAHPVHGPRLDMLRKADSWLDEQLAPPDECPAAEDLYDFAKGPGYGQLEREHHRALVDHMVTCGKCASLVQSLESPPPLPLDLAGTASAPAPSPASTPESILSPRSTERGSSPTKIPGTRFRMATRWIPVAASLAMLVGGLALFQEGVRRDGLPSYPLLRGAAGGNLLFPRGRVLLPQEDQELLFELTPAEGAQRYSLILRTHTGGAFSQGSVVARLDGEGPALILASSLPSGHYTWEAFATVNGLERPLGERDFEVLEDEAMLSQLEGLEGREQVGILHAAGYWTDARAVARRLPVSSERDAYLGSSPGR